MTLALQGTSSTACTEHELVAAVRRGDDRAFELLFSRYERRITAYVAGMVGDHARAEDITQDVFISALRRIRATGRPIAFKPWIYEIAKNACIDEFRRNRRSLEVSFDEDVGVSGLAAQNVFVHSSAPHAAIESKQRLNDLCGAFGGLSESHHRVLVLRELEGLSYNEIGERLGMTRAMVESTLFRARRRLSEEYEELTSGRRCARVQSLIDAGGGQPLTSLGIRDRRQLSRHLAHCQPCRRRARIGGLDESLLQPRRGIARIAALLPLPLLRWRRGGSSDEAATQSGSHSIAMAQTLQNVSQLVDPSGPSAALGRAAAAAAAIALASAGGGIVANLGSPPGRRAWSQPPAPAAQVPTLSITNILAPIKTRSGPAALGSPAAWGTTTGTTRPSNQTAGHTPGSGTGAAIVGAGPADSVSTTGSAHPGGSGAHSAGGASGGPSTGTPPAPPAAPPGDGVSVPNVSSPGTTPPSPPPTPPPPNGSPNIEPSGSPNIGAPQVPNPTEAVQNAQVPSAAQVQSTVQSAPSTVTQTADQVQQSAPSPPAATVTPPSTG
jgi:RNA polymerase sigma factor (sigma-70 family)